MQEIRKKIAREFEFLENVNGIELKFLSTWGLFSPERIDDGSKLLLEYVIVKNQDKILDLGCGLGILGIYLGRKYSETKVEMVDKDFVAVSYANKNIVLNGLSNAEAYLSNMFEQVSVDKRFDLIVSNIPAKVSKEMYWIMFDDMKKHLNNGGRVYLVAIKGLKEFLKRSMKEYFGNCERVAIEKNYVLLKSEKLL